MESEICYLMWVEYRLTMICGNVIMKRCKEMLKWVNFPKILILNKQWRY